MPPNNYIPRIFQGLNRIFTSFSRSHSGPYYPLGSDTRHHSVNLAFAASGALAPRRLSSQLLARLRRRLLLNLLAIFDFAVGALVFASLRLPLSSPSAPWSSPLFACLRLHLWRLGLRLRAEGGVPNSSLSESLPILGGAMTSTSSPEAPPFGPRPIASRSVEPESF